MKYALSIIILFFSLNASSKGTSVIGIGIFDILCDDATDNNPIYFNYENRLDKALYDIGPEEDNFFYLKPLAGIQYTTDNASYFYAGIYLDDNLGELFNNKENRLTFTPSFGVGYFEEGSGKDLGSNIQFKTSLEVNYKLLNDNKIGVSISHMSNANIEELNPGAEIFSISYQIPY